MLQYMEGDRPESGRPMSLTKGYVTRSESSNFGQSWSFSLKLSNKSESMTYGSLPNRLNVDTQGLSPVGNVRDVSDKSGAPLYFGWTMWREIINVDMQNECRMNQHIFFNFRKNNGTRNISRSASFNNAANDFCEVTFSWFPIKVGYFSHLL